MKKPDIRKPNIKTIDDNGGVSWPVSFMIGGAVALIVLLLLFAF